MTDYARLNIYNTDWEKIAYIDSYTSLIWTRRFTTYGDFELYMPWKPSLNDIIKPDYYVEIDGDPDFKNFSSDEIFAMIIERIEYVQETGQPTMMIIKGRCLESLLYRRIFYYDLVISDSTTSYSDNGHGAYLNHMIRTCIGTDTGFRARRMPHTVLFGSPDNPTIPNPTGDDSRVRTINRNDNLGESLNQYLSSWGHGIIVTYDKGAKEYLIRFVDHDDRTSGDNALIFRSDLDNLANCHYIIDNSGTANICRISSNESYATYPNGHGGDISGEYTSIQRREVAFETNLLGEATDRFQALMASGERQLRAYFDNQEITADIITTAELDYKVGDLVKIETDFGVSANVQITEVTRSYSMEGFQRYPVFGTFKILDDVRNDTTDPD